MAADWYYAKGDKQSGPVSAADLKGMAQAGELAPTDKVWKEGMEEWKAAGTIKGLFPSPPASVRDRLPPPPLPASRDGGRPSEPSAVLTHPLVRKVLSDKLLLLGCCLGVSLILTVILPSLLSPGQPPPKLKSSTPFSELSLEEMDAHLDADRAYYQQGSKAGSARLAFVMLDVALLTLLGFVGYRRFYSTTIDKLYDQGGPELPPNYPWPKEERTAPNPKHLWVRVGIGACVVIGLICLLSIVGAIFCLPFFSAAILLYVFGLNRRLFHGRWIPASGKGWVEFLPGHVVKREDGSTGTFALLGNQQFIDFLDGGKLVDSWKVLSFEHSTHLEILDMAGKTHGFKRAKIGVYKTSGLFTSDRRDLLTEKWEPVDGNGPAIQFTDDGAIIRFDGFAARYTFSGEEPNEVITIHVNDTDTIELKVLSLSRDEMVLTGEGGSVHYKRGVSISAAEAKKRADAFNDKLKTVGKAALATVGVIGAGIAVLGVAAAAATTTTCPWCGFTRSGLHMNCPGCGRYS